MNRPIRSLVERAAGAAGAAGAASLLLALSAQAASTLAPLPPEFDRGRYLVLLGHCNNCHTATYMERAGNVAESDWLLGNPVGFRTGAGTAFASNLRMTVAGFGEAQWIAYATSVKTRPPMPWWSLHDTRPDDLRAMYRYIRHLGTAGRPAPDFVPLDREAPRPFLNFRMEE